MPKVHFYFLLVGKVLPKLMVTAELQAFQNPVLSAWMKLRIKHFNRFCNFGLKYAGFAFQPMHRIFRLRLYKIVVLCRQVLLSKREYGNSSVLVSRIQPSVVVITVIAYIFHLLFVKLRVKQNRLSVRKPTLNCLFSEY